MTVDLLSSEVLTLEEMAARLGVSCEEVLRREQAGDLFSYFKQSRGIERLYPIYQLAPEIYPGLLRRAKAALGPDSVMVDAFFTLRDPDLAHMSVREVLARRTREGFESNSVTSWLLSLPMTRRMDAVMAALERTRAVSEGW